MAEKHPCKGDYLDKLIQPAILSLLCEKPAHGFYLIAELERRELMTNVDAAGFYRALKRLEEDGKLESMWCVEAGEKPKKVYTITESGIRCLNNWQKTLNEYTRYVAAIYETVNCALAKTGAVLAE